MAFTTDWVTQFIPSWTKHVVPVLAGRPGVKWLEVGSFEGRSALWTLDNLLQGPGSELTCVDLWQRMWLQKGRPETNFDENTRGRANLRKLRGSSDEVLPTLPVSYFDGVYVDGCHEEENVYRDAHLCLPLLKPGAFMIFDDYEDRDGTPLKADQVLEPRQFGVNAAVGRFLKELGEEIVVLHRGWQLIARLR